MSFALLWLLTSANASPVPTLWQNNVPYGSTLVPTRDGGALVLGIDSVTLFDIDADLTRIDSNGTILWMKTYGGTGIDHLGRGVELPNGDFILLGESGSSSSGTKQSPCFGDDDFWLVRVSSSGELIWERSWGGSERELAVSLVVSNDSIFAFGNSYSPVSGNKTSPNAGYSDYAVVKFNLAGELQWDKSFGLEGWEWLITVLHDAASNRIYLVGESTRPPDQPPRDPLAPPYLRFCWVVSLDLNGEQLWQKSYSMTEFNGTYAATFLGDGSIAIGGIALRNIDGPPWTISSPFVLKIDRDNGQAQWSKLLGDEHDFVAMCPAANPASVVIATKLDRPRPGTEDAADITYYIDEVNGGGEPVRSIQRPGFGAAETFVSKLHYSPGRGYLFTTTVQNYFEATKTYGEGGDILFWWLNENFETIGTTLIGGDKSEILSDVAITPSGDIIASAISDSDRSQTKTMTRPEWDGVTAPPDWIFKMPGSFVPNPPTTELFIEPAALRITEDATPLVLRAATPAEFLLEYTEDFLTWNPLRTVQLTTEPFHTLDPAKSANRFYRLRRP